MRDPLKDLMVEDNVLNLNDALAWASADGEPVEDSERPRVTELFFRYGWCGILYWVTREKRKVTGTVSEFCDVQRWVDFVEQEERIREEVPECGKRAYVYCEYTIPAKGVK